jgi:tRNA-splicing ligase RtcB
MEIKNTLYVTTRKDWRKWLAKNHKKKKEVWLIYYRKETKKPRISYDAAKEKHFGSDVWIHRKGATHVTSDITGIIPGSMGHPSYLVRGKNNAESFNSCSHGAGRVMSRKKAKSELDIDMFTAQMEGIYSTSVDIHHLDEAPDAYKNIDEVMENQTDLVNVQLKLTPVLNIKG